MLQADCVASAKPHRGHAALLFSVQRRAETSRARRSIAGCATLAKLKTRQARAWAYGVHQHEASGEQIKRCNCTMPHSQKATPAGLQTGGAALIAHLSG